MYNYLTLTRIAGGFLFRSAHISVGKYSLDLNRLKPIKKAINPRAAIGTRLIAEAGNQTRTDDPLITSEVLYQLSYSGTRGYAHQLLYRLRAKVQEKILVIIQHPQKTDEIRTESLLAERFQKFSEGRTSGEAALTAHNEERKAF